MPWPSARSRIEVQQRAGLRHEGDLAPSRHPGGEGGVQLEHGVDDAQHVRADHAHPVALGDVDHLLFQRLALRADLAEAGGDDDGALQPALAAFLQDARHRFVRHQDHGQIDRVRAVQHAGIRLAAEDLRCCRVDRIDAALVAVLDDVVEDLVAQLLRAGGGADDRDPSGSVNISSIVSRPGGRWLLANDLPSAEALGTQTMNIRTTNGSRSGPVVKDVYSGTDLAHVNDAGHVGGKRFAVRSY